MTKIIKLAVIINSFNRYHLLKNCLENIISIRQKTSFKIDVIVIDAGSSDQSLEYLTSLQENEKDLIVLMSKGATFSEGCNLGVKKAIEMYQDLEYILLFETDNYFNNEVPLITGIELIKEQKNAACVGFTIKNYSGQKISYGHSKPNLLSFFLGQSFSSKLGISKAKINWIKYNKLKYTKADIIFTSPLLIKTEAWKKVNGMDSNLFPFSDSDTDLCLSFLKYGYDNLVIDIEGVIHDNQNQKSEWSSKRVIDYQLAHNKLMIKHYPKFKNFIRIILPLKYRSEILIGKLIGKPQSFLETRRELIKLIGLLGNA